MTCVGIDAAYYYIPYLRTPKNDLLKLKSVDTRPSYIIVELVACILFADTIIFEEILDL